MGTKKHERWRVVTPPAKEPARAVERSYFSVLVMLVAAREDIHRLCDQQLPGFGIKHKGLFRHLQRAEQNVLKAERVMVDIAKRECPGMELPPIVEE